MKNITLLLIVIFILLFSLYNKKIVCENNGVFIIIVIILFYLGIKNNNYLYEPFLSRDECKNNCKNKMRDRHCPDIFSKPDKEINITFNTVNDKEDSSKRCIIKTDNQYNFEHSSDYWKNKRSKNKIISPDDSDPNPIGWSWNINDPDGFGSEDECKKVCPDTKEYDTSNLTMSSDFKIKKENLEGKVSSSDNQPFLENNYYYFGADPKDKTKKYCNVVWYDHKNNSIINKNKDKSEIQQRYYNLVDCHLNNIPRPKHSETEKINIWINNVKKNNDFYKNPATDENIKEYGKWIDGLIKKVNSGNFYNLNMDMGVIDSQWCGPGTSPIDPKLYDGIVDIKTCVTNSEWLMRNDKLCIDAFYEKKLCEQHPNQAINKWNNTSEIKEENNRLNQLLSQMKKEIINEIKNNQNQSENNNNNNNNNESSGIDIGRNIFQNLFQNLFSLNTPPEINESDGSALEMDLIDDEQQETNIPASLEDGSQTMNIPSSIEGSRDEDPQTNIGK